MNFNVSSISIFEKIKKIIAKCNGYTKISISFLMFPLKTLKNIFFNFYINFFAPRKNVFLAFIFFFPSHVSGSDLRFNVSDARFELHLTNKT